RVKAQSTLRQISSMKFYLDPEAINQFDEADLLARMEWINSLNQAFDSAQTSLERLDFAEISSNHRIEFAEWPEFLATFNTVIGNDDELSDIEKLQYLRSSLGGVALETIRSLEPSNANYKEAMNLLVNRFDNKVLHFQAHVQAIFGL
ncbi:hypothetical protein KR084_002343, partial [Drosophila pseudotakahashii]